MGEKENKGWSSLIGNVDTLLNRQGRKLIKRQTKNGWCTFDNIPVTALWDTGAQATVINDEWRAEHLPHTTIRGTEEVLGPEPLNGIADNQTVILFIGWVPVEFKLRGADVSSSSLLVPLLVSSDPNVAQDPIIGFNLIEEIINEQTTQQGTKITDCATSIVSNAFDTDVVSAKTFIQLMHTHQTADIETSQDGMG